MDRELKLALRYHTRAAEGGMVDSQRTLAENYLLGRRAPEAIRLNVAEDPVRAYMWYRLLGDGAEMAKLRKKLTPLQVAQGEAMAATVGARHHP